MKNWLRYLLIVLCCPFGIVYGVWGLSYWGKAGISSERTISVAAEGLVIAPREAFAHMVVLLLAAAVWVLLWVSALAPPESRARLALRSSAGGAIALACAAVVLGAFCGEVAGWIIIGVAVASPPAVAFVVVKAGIEHAR